MVDFEHAGAGMKSKAIGGAAQVAGFEAPKQQAQPVVDDTGQMIGTEVPKMGYWSNALYSYTNNTPKATHGIGYSIFRGSNTIMGGGSGGPNNMWANMKPKSIGRYSSAEIFRPPGAVNGPEQVGKNIFKRNKKDYSPFNIGDSVNSAGDFIQNSRSKAWEKASKAIIGQDVPMMDGPSGFAKVGGEVSDVREAMARSKNPAVRASNWLENKGVLSKSREIVTEGGETILKAPKQEIWQRGMMAHMRTQTRLSMMGDKAIGDKIAGNLNNTMDILKDRPAIGNSMNVVAGKAGSATEGAFNGTMTGRQAGMDYLAQSASGTISSQVSGYMGGARYGNEILGRGGNEAFEKGASKAAEHLATGGITSVESATGKELVQGFGKSFGGAIEKSAAQMAEKEGLKVAEKFGTKVLVKEGEKIAVKETLKIGGAAAAKYGLGMVAGLFSGPVGWAADVAMTASMIYDIGKLGVTMANEMVIKPTVNFVKDGFKSFKGDIDKAPMGMGFKDNSVIATARQRGVMAISNSRLNARSVLGNEAGGIAAHFGGPKPY